MPIASLTLTNVGPFDDIEFEFDRQVNVFTGPNNSGKSTVLWALGDIFVPDFEFPRKLFRRNSADFRIRLIDGTYPELEGRFPISVRDNSDYWNHQRMEQHMHLVESIGYAEFIPSLRLSTDFRSPGPTAKTGIGNNENSLYENLEKYFTRTSLIRDEDFTRASLIKDEDVIQKIIDLDYRSYRRNKPVYREIIAKASKLASEITEGFPVEFLGVTDDAHGLFLQFHTPDGDVPFNVLSQGTQSIIQWLARFLIGYAEYYDFPDNLEDKPSVFIVDEIDAHLHPSWQRRIIPALIRHFPKLQVFCSTHAPLMLAGLKEGQVQLLRRDEEGKITVSRNEEDVIGWSMDEITRFLLDVPDPVDLETLEHLDRLRELRRKQTLSPDESAELEKLRHTVNRNLLNGPQSAEVKRFTELIQRARTESGNIVESAPSIAVDGDAQAPKETSG